MLTITMLTVLPEAFTSFLSYPVIRHAIDNGLVRIEVEDIRKHTAGCWRAVDDSPYGGGAGLLIRVDSLSRALSAVRTERSRTILLGPKGKRFTQEMARALASEEHIILVCGHYEGVDERFRSRIDEEVSIGDYILTGGESAAIVVAEAVSRLLEGALRAKATEQESFDSPLLEMPQYTHPALFEGEAVPPVLLSGDREAIERFNEIEAVKDTVRLRPDLIAHDRELKHVAVHCDYGNEAEIMKWLSGRLPVGRILFQSGEHLVLSRGRGRPLSECSRARMLSTAAALLKRLWSLDSSSCPVSCHAGDTVRKAKEGLHSARQWELCQELEKAIPTLDEDSVFSHGSLTLENIYVDGKGLRRIEGLQKAGCADRYRDLATIIPSLEARGITREELASRLGMAIDEERLCFFMRLRELE